MAETKNTTTDALEERYLAASRLVNSIRCLIHNKDVADIYDAAAKIYKALGDYKDSPELYSQCIQKAEQHKALADKELEEEKINVTPNIKDDDEKKGFFHKPLLVIVLLILIVAVAGVVYLKTVSGRYARACFYEKNENYEKSYKMFGNLKDYKDSESKSLACRYAYASECVANGDLENAKKAYRALADYKDSEQKLAETEIQIIKNTDIGGNVLFGEAHWIIVEKQQNKVLLVKSLPVNGFAYNNKSKSVTWENCSLRAYLNNEFFSEIFTDAMAQSIIETDISVPDTDKYNTIGGNPTTDKVFLLNADQFVQYQELLSNYLRDCWLINPGSTQSTAQFVSYGEVMDYGYDVSNTNIYIRPALWLSIE
jgi:tetratricopeptide (TPR) repeat protein